MTDTITQEVIAFMEKTQYLRECQKKYFEARKGHDASTANKYYGICKQLEPEVDRIAADLVSRLKHGEQQSLF